MNKSTGILLALTGFFAGIILGFLLSPIKYGLKIGSNNGNDNYIYGTNNDKSSNPDALEF